MRSLVALARAHFRMQRREPAYWVITLGLAVSIIVVYGNLFADPASPQLGVVLEDRSPTLADAVDRLEGIEELSVSRGTRQEELTALENGERWAVLVVPEATLEATARRGAASVEVVYSDRSPFEATTGRGVLREFVAGLNEALLPASEDSLSLEERAVEGRRTLTLLDVLFPGVIGMTLMFGNSWAAGTIVWWRYLGVLRRLGTSPLYPLTLELAQLVTFAVLSALQVTLLVALAILLFDVEVAGSYLDLAALCGLGVVAFMGIWYAYAAVMPSTTSFFSFLNLTSFVMMFLGGSAFPIEDVPGWLTPLVQALPLTHLNEALRGVVNRGEGLSDQLGEIAILAGWAAGGFAVSVRLFRWGRA